MLGQCSSLTELDLRGNRIDEDGIAMLRACWPGDSGLEIGVQYDMVDDVEDMDFPGGYGFFYLDDEEDMDFSS